MCFLHLVEIQRLEFNLLISLLDIDLFHFFANRCIHFGFRFTGVHDTVVSGLVAYECL